MFQARTGVYALRVIRLVRSLPRAVGAVLGLVESGAFNPAVDRTFPLAETIAAVRRAEEPGRSGAVVLLDEPAGA